MVRPKVVYLSNPLTDPVVRTLAEGLSGAYIDLPEVLETLMSGIAYNIVEEPNEDFPFEPYQHYDSMMRDILSVALHQYVDDVDDEMDRVIDDYVEDFVEMHNRVYYRLTGSVRQLNDNVSEDTHIWNITSVTGASLHDLNGDDDDLQILFLPRQAHIPRGNYYGQGYSHSQYH